MIETIRDYLNGEISLENLMLELEIVYCNVCGTYNLKDDTDETYDGNVYCPSCDHVVLGEEIEYGD